MRCCLYDTWVGEVCRGGSRGEGDMGLWILPLGEEVYLLCDSTT